MLKDSEDIQKLKSSIIKYFEQEYNYTLVEILKHSIPSSETTYYDSTDGTYYYDIIFEVEIEIYAKNHSLIDNYEKEVLEKAKLFVKNSKNEQICKVCIRPKCKLYLNWENLPYDVTKESIINLINDLKSIMINVSTGITLIENANSDYKDKYKTLTNYFSVLGIDNPNSYDDLWGWYKRWSKSDLHTYALRREFVSKLFSQTISEIEESTNNNFSFSYEQTGWGRVDRTIYGMNKQLSTAKTEEQFQVVGLLGREALITVAQQVFDKEKHITKDDINPSEADSKRMLDAFIHYRLGGKSNERYRKFAKSAVDLANHLTHDRTADKSSAELCLTAVNAVVSLIRALI